MIRFSVANIAALMDAYVVPNAGAAFLHYAEARGHAPDASISHEEAGAIVAAVMCARCKVVSPADAYQILDSLDLIGATITARGVKKIVPMTQVSDHPLLRDWAAPTFAEMTAVLLKAGATRSVLAQGAPTYLYTQAIDWGTLGVGASAVMRFGAEDDAEHVEVVLHFGAHSNDPRAFSSSVIMSSVLMAVGFNAEVIADAQAPAPTPLPPTPPAPDVQGPEGRVIH